MDFSTRRVANVQELLDARSSAIVRRQPVEDGRCPLRRRAARLVLLLVLGALPAAAFAQSHYTVDAGHSTVHFSLGDTLHQFGGVFHISSGSIDFDRTTGAMSGRIVVDAASGDSGSAARDKKMTNQELKAKSFPSVVFEPNGFTGTVAHAGPSQIQVKGIFTLLGQPHPLTIPMTVQIDGDHCIVSGSFTVPYIAWGLKDPSMLFIRMGKEVKIELTLNGQLSAH